MLSTTCKSMCSTEVRLLTRHIIPEFWSRRALANGVMPRVKLFSWRQNARLLICLTPITRPLSSNERSDVLNGSGHDCVPIRFWPIKGREIECNSTRPKCSSFGSAPKRVKACFAICRVTCRQQNSANKPVEQLTGHLHITCIFCNNKYATQLSE